MTREQQLEQALRDLLDVMTKADPRLLKLAREQSQPL